MKSRPPFSCYFDQQLVETFYKICCKSHAGYPSDCSMNISAWKHTYNKFVTSIYKLREIKETNKDITFFALTDSYQQKPFWRE